MKCHKDLGFIINKEGRKKSGKANSIRRSRRFGGKTRFKLFVSQGGPGRGTEEKQTGKSRSQTKEKRSGTPTGVKKKSIQEGRTYKCAGKKTVVRSSFGGKKGNDKVSPANREAKHKN